MRYLLVAAVVVTLLLVACDGANQATSEVSPKNTPAETLQVAGPSPTAAPLIRKSGRNTLVEAPAYTGIIFSEEAASQFGFVFGSSVSAFWEPSVDDIATAEDSIRRFLVSIESDPTFESYRREDLSFILNNLGEYERQYVGIVVEGEKRIWTNLFFSDDLFPDWQSRPVYVLDGGKDFWQIEYDLLKDESINFYVHGEA